MAIRGSTQVALQACKAPHDTSTLQACKPPHEKAKSMWHSEAPLAPIPTVAVARARGQKGVVAVVAATGVEGVVAV